MSLDTKQETWHCIWVITWNRVIHHNKIVQTDFCWVHHLCGFHGDSLGALNGSVSERNRVHH